MLHSESNHTPSQLKANSRQDKKVWCVVSDCTVVDWDYSIFLPF